MTDRDLLPCPFCGGNPRYGTDEYSGDSKDANFFIACDKCPVMLHVWSSDGWTFDSLISQWNKRHQVQSVSQL